MEYDPCQELRESYFRNIIATTSNEELREQAIKQLEKENEYKY